jgi:hypothetical protein
MLKHILLAACLAASIPSAHAQVPSYLGRYQGSQHDTDAILQVTKDFQAALLGKDAKKLSGLFLHPNILFTSPASPARVKQRRQSGDGNFDGINVAGASDFVAFIATSSAQIEEKFYNIRITQDSHLAWVMFDFEFLEGKQVTNHGLETWQMLKTDDVTWKIFSVVWSSNGAPK